jgi:hypothetical protein
VAGYCKCCIRKSWFPKNNAVVEILLNSGTSVSFNTEFVVHVVSSFFSFFLFCCIF